MAALPPMTSSDFAAALNVSRETLAKLEVYEAMLRQWQNTINLISSSTLHDVWRRHFFDSGQLCPLLLNAETIVDIGSGGGFPGLVVAIMTDAPVYLVESDNRKATFLREVSRATSANANILAGRAESLPPRPAAAVTVRALAPLPKLLSLVEPWVQPGGRCYFLKGSTFEEELTDAKKIWDISYDLVPSRSDPSGTILRVKEFRRV